MTDCAQRKEMGHAAGTLHALDEYTAVLKKSPELRRRIIRDDILANLRQFGPAFLSVLSPHLREYLTPDDLSALVPPPAAPVESKGE